MVVNSSPTYFGAWLKNRRQTLDLTQSELALQACCSVSALRKIETGERRPSKQLAEMLARALGVSAEEQRVFIKVARGELELERLDALSQAHEDSAVFRLQKKPAPSHASLPTMLTPFIGREPELDALGRLLSDPQCRLITLVGQGGVGKTRLAIEAANRHTDLFPDGIWFISLSPLSSPDLLISAAANALNLRSQDTAQLKAQLFQFLEEKRALLVLDNGEHLVEGFEMFTEIQQNTRRIKLLVTSQERLNLLSEWVFELQGLPVPSSHQDEAFTDYSSVALFLQSARRVQTGFELREEDREEVIKICSALGGIPLGIELAAAWVELLSCAAIAKEICENLDFLTVSMRDLPERHHSMRAILDHSWKLLNPEQKQVLSRLSVFQGCFRLEAAKAVCGANLAILSSLRNKSLLNRVGPSFYELHPLIRQYAALKLAEDPGVEEQTKDQHAFYYSERLLQAEKALKSSHQVETLNEMALKINNLRQAWQWMIGDLQTTGFTNHRFSPALFHRSLFSLSLFYEMRYRNWEAINIFRASIESLEAARDDANFIKDQAAFDAVLGHITAYLGLHQSYVLQYKQARESLHDALILLENSQSRLEKAQAQVMLAAINSKQGHLQESIDLLEQSRAVFQEAGDAWWYPLSVLHLAGSYLLSGKFRKSQALYREGSQLVEPGDLRLRVPLQNGIAYSWYLQNDFSSAEQILLENLPLSYQLGFDRLTASVQQYLGQVALATNRLELADQYLRKSIDLFRQYGESPDLALVSIHFGKLLISRSEVEAARVSFWKAIKIGQSLDIFYLVYWGLVNLARTDLLEGRTEKALEMALVLQRYPVEYKEAQEDGMCLLAELKAILPDQQIKQIHNQASRKTVDYYLNLG